MSIAHTQFDAGGWISGYCLHHVILISYHFVTRFGLQILNMLCKYNLILCPTIPKCIWDSINGYPDISKFRRHLQHPSRKSYISSCNRASLSHLSITDCSILITTKEISFYRLFNHLVCVSILIPFRNKGLLFIFVSGFVQFKEAIVE